VLTSFSATEREAARKLSSHDPRLAAALDDPHYGVTEVLAGAPQLVARYEQASEEQRAVLDAAIDARRLGIQAPLTGTLLCAAARGYLRTLHPDDTWLDPALTELIQDDRPQDHATAPLIRVYNEEKSEIAGNTVADYLMQHASRERRYKRVPASTGGALSSLIRDPPTPPGSRTAPGTGCCSATPSRCTVTPPTPATSLPPPSWPGCWPGAATSTRRGKYWPTPTMSTPPGS